MLTQAVTIGLIYIAVAGLATGASFDQVLQDVTASAALSMSPSSPPRTFTSELAGNEGPPQTGCAAQPLVDQASCSSHTTSAYLM
jgi:hypothetical protein